jgi:hypothetical protein
VKCVPINVAVFFSVSHDNESRLKVNISVNLQFEVLWINAPDTATARLKQPKTDFESSHRELRAVD